MSKSTVKAYFSTLLAQLAEEAKAHFPDAAPARHGRDKPAPSKPMFLCGCELCNDPDTPFRILHTRVDDTNRALNKTMVKMLEMREEVAHLRWIIAHPFKHRLHNFMRWGCGHRCTAYDKCVCNNILRGK